jgi:hypothetical protein
VWSGSSTCRHQWCLGCLPSCPSGINWPGMRRPLVSRDRFTPRSPGVRITHPVRAHGELPGGRTRAASSGRLRLAGLPRRSHHNQSAPRPNHRAAGSAALRGAPEPGAARSGRPRSAQLGRHSVDGPAPAAERRSAEPATFRPAAAIVSRKRRRAARRACHRRVAVDHGLRPTPARDAASAIRSGGIPIRAPIRRISAVYSTS